LLSLGICWVNKAEEGAELPNTAIAIALNPTINPIRTRVILLHPFV